jgi:hypothetical protein
VTPTGIREKDMVIHLTPDGLSKVKKKMDELYHLEEGEQ